MSSLPKSDNTNTPVRTAFDGVTTRRRGGAVSPSEQMEVSLFNNDAVNISAQNETLELTDHQSLVLELRLFREEMCSTRRQLTELNNTLSALSARMNGCEEKVNALTLRTGDLERRLEESLTNGSSDKKLMESIQQLKSELNDRDQELLSNDIEISCIPEEKGESVPHIVLTVASKLGVKLEVNDVVSCTRIGPMLESSNKGSTARPHDRPRPRLIVARLTRRSLRDELLKAARIRRGATTEGTDLPGPHRRFYINERLTRFNRQLFRRARELAGQHGWRYVWSRDGKIFVRKDQSDSPRHRIRNESDLARVFGPVSVS